MPTLLQGAYEQDTIPVQHSQKLPSEPECASGHLGSTNCSPDDADLHHHCDTGTVTKFEGILQGIYVDQRRFVLSSLHYVVTTLHILRYATANTCTRF